MGSAETPYDLAKFRILMVHGFAQNGSQFRAKASRISNRITQLLTPKILSEFPGRIEFLYPDAPLILEHPIGLGLNSVDRKEEQKNERQNFLPLGYEKEGFDLFGWWYGRDNVSRYRGIEASLSYVATYIHGRPIHGILGFSQGGALAGMISSLIDCSDNPEKIAAIRAQGLPVDDFLKLPAQKPLRCCISIAGYMGTVRYYGSLYQWPIQTPSVHALASMDAVVEHYGTVDLAECFSSYEIVQYHGSHFCPRDRLTVEALAHFMLKNCWGNSAAPVLPQSIKMIDDEDWSDFGRKESGRSLSKRSDSVGSDKSAENSTIWRRHRKTFVTRGRCTPSMSPRRPIPASAQSYLRP
ncbi:hypothetical protein N7520_002068 [Penicillium odoratum]|uniref:uncharacterized protein n=1 Tax=Penicillium odoratum TaxID=1167516 RepID=UPI0025499954|nr:uncharacterized protein N7520_002068 [Penicillium odoratum]KAJ5771539.1 hypothetical protein N7520_002068 [Penicillium odoratum]